MHKLVTLLILLPLFTNAQNTLLYELTHPETGNSSYLFGTMHVRDERAFAFNDSVYWAINQCDKTAFELNLDPKVMSAALSKESITQLIDTAFVDRLTTFLADDFIPKLMKKVPAEKLAYKITNELLPGYFDFLQNYLNGNNRTTFVDQYLQNYSRQKGKKIIGIETYSEQISTILGDLNEYQFDDKRLSSKMVNYLLDNELKINLTQVLNGTNDMIEFYSDADLTGLCTFLTDPTESNPITTKIYDRLLIDRNEIMFQRTKQDVMQGKIFIAVGAGHLCGKNGLIQQYKNEGYTIRPMDIKTPHTTNISWETVEMDGYTVDLPLNVSLSASTPSIFNTYLGIDSSFKNTLFTPKGSATFTITAITDYMEEISMNEDFIEDMEEPEYEYIQEDLIIESDSYEMDMQAPIEELSQEEFFDEAVTAAEQAVEDAVNAIEKENLEASDLMDKILIEEYPEQPTEGDLEVYDTVEDYEETPKYRSPFNKERIRAKFSVKQQAYFKELGDSVTKYFSSKMMDISGDMMAMYNVKTDTLIATIHENKQDLYYSSGMLAGNTLSSEIIIGNQTYKLVIKGDPEILKSNDLHRFFTSFKVKE
ncbi:MAG: hypothetical protein COA58_13570 [Bacteroidetes bacterium]|nr:MAG: hypothetical protein COA58_13570 [Bacteroidota bacterium]